MQDFQPIPGLTGRIFTAAAAAATPTGSDTTCHLRNYPSSSSSFSTLQARQLPIKCPRCDSTNTKFCYYNNYNLSQPRHFCKACRRYWTKGGVLRNVPVGGGCRKSSKRSSSKPASSKPDKADRCSSKPASASGSSSESSNPNPLLDPPAVYAEAAGSFTNLMEGADGVVNVGFGFSDPGPEQKGVELEIGGRGGLHGLDWVGSGESGSLFDITSSVDPAVYWNQTQWGDTDPSLYLP